MTSYGQFARAVAEDDYEKRRLNLFCADLQRELDRLVYKLDDLTALQIIYGQPYGKRRLLSNSPRRLSARPPTWD